MVLSRNCIFASGLFRHRGGCRSGHQHQCADKHRHHRGERQQLRRHWQFTQLDRQRRRILAQGMVFPGSRWTAGARYTDTELRHGLRRPGGECPGRGPDVLRPSWSGRRLFHWAWHRRRWLLGRLAPRHPSAPIPRTATGGGVARLPGTCRFSPMPADTPRCCYMVDRQATTFSPANKLGGRINYTGGQIRWAKARSQAAGLERAPTAASILWCSTSAMAFYPPSGIRHSAMPTPACS